MTKVDIISGFLGAGKTTFIKKLIEDVFPGERLVLIENEFGEIGIDGGFLKDAITTHAVIRNREKGSIVLHSFYSSSLPVKARSYLKWYTAFSIYWLLLLQLLSWCLTHCLKISHR